MTDTARLIRPPQLRTDEPASASGLELFFDLAYVLVVLQLADQFLHDPDWSGAVIFAGLFTGAIVHAALAQRVRAAKTGQTADIVLIICDGGWKYLSTGAYTTSYSAIEFNGFPPLEAFYI